VTEVGNEIGAVFFETERTRRARAVWAKIPREMDEEYGRMHNLDRDCTEMYATRGELSTQALVLLQAELSVTVTAQLYWLCKTYGLERIEHCWDILRKIGWLQHEPYRVAKIRADVARLRRDAKAIRAAMASDDEETGKRR